ncbi:PQQ-dependent sugar dehydrogenase [Luteolibacter arcticus]|uniref:PQQ-dependent sugar dehydrogenase n=1 Tax=Luteolibacter arcticus TaxID=1581411 RepID=A0ABT3GGP7_9BACT|nr:PQQ-dependent sugar dehydrogenase [Luteolibacter arcticus]MCW1922781.1 PQQ-dependent sugar dehydrogenase [Luteolibacter arcticus]
MRALTDPLLLAALLWGGQLDAALVGHYKFDENAGATIALNQVAGSSTGAVGSTVTTGAAGIAGNAYRFNNSVAQAGIVDMGDASFFSAIHDSGELTISAWVKTTDTTGNRNTAVFAGDNTVANVYADLGVAAGQAGFPGAASARNRPVGAAAVQQTGIFSLPAVPAVNDGAWHHLVMTVDLSGAQLAVWVDGTLANTQTMAVADFPDFNNFEIGRLGRATPADPFDGFIDDVQVYNEVLSESHVQYLHSHPGLSLSTGLPPMVAADAVTMHHLGSALLDVIGNDEPGVQAATVEILASPSSGTAVPDAKGKILYKHLTGTPATDTFTYRVKGSSGVFSAPATVTVDFSTALRIANTTVQMPAGPPAMSFSVVNAFPGVTFTKPATMESPAGDPNRLFVAERGGRIYVIPDINAASPVKLLYLDLSPVTLDDGNEQGLKGFAFHPDFATNGYVFACYNHLEAGFEYVRVSRFKSDSPATNTPIPVATEEILINQLYLPESGNQPRIHNIAECNFGPDGYLYIGSGDADGHPDPSNNSQRIDKDFWAALLSIDVDLEPEDHTPADGTGGDDANVPPNSHPAVVLHGGFPLYEVPADNPFVGATSFNGLPVNPANVRNEFYAVGLRNPWQFTWDSLNGNLWLGEVGYNTREEINLITKGGNYGWAFLEGDLPTKGVPPAAATLTGPVWQYNHGAGPFQGNAVIGGLVYRGNRYPSLYGKYIFADHLSGNIWSMNAEGGPPVVERIAGESGIASFALDPSDSSLLLLDHGDGVVRRLVGTTTSGGFPQTLSATGVFADLTDLSPNPGVVAYEPNLPFWSDHAIKKRWFAIGNTSDQFTYAAEGPWQSPVGAVFAKHFDLELERGNPATKKRIETRLLVRTAEGVYGVSYRWNEAGTEADLVADEGVSFDLSITDHGNPVVQTWQIPSRSQCNTCHTPQAGHFLSLNTRQLNRPGSLAGTSGNFLTLLGQAGYLDSLPQSPNLLPRHVRPDETAYTLETRVRSYLTVNCSYCHQSGGTGGGDFDLRAPLSLESTGIVNGATSSAGPPYQLIVPGDHDLSVIWNRIATANGFTRMPPLATSQLDQSAIQLLQEWIDDTLPDRQFYDPWRLEQFGTLISQDGDPNEDPDTDGLSNHHEFLTGTDPNSGSSLWNPGLTLGTSSLTFPNLENRKTWLESSTDLQSWSLWNVPGNNGLPVTGPTRTFPRDPSDAHRFFRFQIEEP